MKLELKHYLDAFKFKVPFKITELGIFNMDLEFPNERYYGTGIITDLSTYNQGKEISGTLMLENECSFDFDFKIGEEPEIIPCFRPLSDLAKEIEVNGEKFVPVEKIKNEWGYNEFQYQGYFNFAHWFKLDNEEPAILHLPYCFLELMFEWHFDVFGLIEKGLAIDINTL